MTEATKAAVLAWVDAQDGYKNYVGKLDNSEGALNLDGWFNLYELAEDIEAAERERCAKIAREQKDKWSQVYIASATIDTTNEASARVNTAMDIEEKIRGGK